MSTSLEMLLHNFEELIVRTAAMFNTRFSSTPVRAGAYAAFLTTAAGSIYFQAGEKMERQLRKDDMALARA